MKILQSRLGRILLAATAVLFLLVSFFFVTRPQPILTFRLTDGTEVAVNSVQVGKEFKIYNGTSLQQSLYRVAGERLSSRFVGSESSFPASHTNAMGKSLGVILHRFAPHAFLSTPWNGNQSLALIDAKGKETPGVRLLVNFDTELVNEKTKVKAEQILWEFPTSTEKDLHFRLYDTNAVTGKTATNDFHLTNPQ